MDYDNGATAGESTTPSAAELSRKSMPTRQYLDETVAPIVQQALLALNMERPADPIDFLANFLLREKGRFEAVPKKSGGSKKPNDATWNSKDSNKENHAPGTRRTQK